MKKSRSTKAVDSSTAKAKQRGRGKKAPTTAIEEEKRKNNEQLKAFFRECDLDGNGTINRKELEIVMSKLGAFNGPQISLIMDEVDKNNDGVISFDEFVDWLTEHPDADRSMPMSFDFDALVRPLFEIWDLNRSGKITFDEFKLCHAIMTSALDAADTIRGISGRDQVVKLVSGHEDIVWRAVDADHDAEVTFLEFTSWLRSCVEHAGLEKDRIVELITKQTLLLENARAVSGRKSISESSVKDLMHQLGACQSELFRRSNSIATVKDDSKVTAIDPELWRQLPGPASHEELIRKHMEEVVPAEGMLKTEATVKSCIATRNGDSIRLLSLISRTSVYRTRQGDVPPGQPVSEQYFYSSDGEEWQSLGKDGSEYFKSVKELHADMRLYSRMHAAANFKEQISWKSIQEVLQESVEIGLLTKEDQMSFNADIEKAVFIAISRKEALSDDEISEESERREKAKNLLPEMPFDVLEVMAELAGLNIIPVQPLWHGIRFRATLP